MTPSRRRRGGGRGRGVDAQRADRPVQFRLRIGEAPISGCIGRALVTEGVLLGQGEAMLAVIEQINPGRQLRPARLTELLNL